MPFQPPWELPTHRHTNKKKSFLKQRLPCFLELDGLFSKGNAKLGKNTPRTCVLEHHGSVPERIKEDTCMEHAVFGVLFYFVCMGFFGAKDTTQNLTNAKQTLCHCYCILDKKFVCVLHLCMYKYV